MKFVMHNVSEKSRKQSGIERERKPEPPTGLLISFDWLFFFHLHPEAQVVIETCSIIFIILINVLKCLSTLHGRGVREHCDTCRISHGYNSVPCWTYIFFMTWISQYFKFSSLFTVGQNVAFNIHPVVSIIEFDKC